MEKRIPTLDEYIAESQQILEGKKFDWDAKKLAKAWNDNASDDMYTPDNLEVSLWVTMANQLNMFNIEVWKDYADEFSMAGFTKEGVFIGIDSTEERNVTTINIYRVKPEDPEAFKEENEDVAPMDWSSDDDITVESITYNPEKLNVKAVTHQVQKILKKFIQIMK